MSYAAVVGAIAVRPLPGSDNIQLGTICNSTVIVGKDVQEGQLMVFFEAGGQLSEEFATQNDLVRRKDAEGKAAGGFFEDNRRVKALRMRGAKSEGYACPLSAFEYTGMVPELVEGHAFTTLGDHKICQKYYTPRAERTMRENAQRESRRANKMFARHGETDALKHVLNMIPPGSLVHVSEKLHGTSHRHGHVQFVKDQPRSWAQRVALRWGLKGLANGIEWAENMIRTRYWAVLDGSRNVELNDRVAVGWHGSESFRFRVVDAILPHKGEVLYGEIVGYVAEDKSIMGRQPTGRTGVKQHTERYGEQVVFSYGTEPGESKFFVYKITRVDEDGHAVPLTYWQMRARATELGLECPPHIETFLYDGDGPALFERMNLLVNGKDGQSAFPSRLDTRHPQEGVVLCVESPDGRQKYIKHKSWAFLVLEGVLRENPEFVDEEEVS